PESGLEADVEFKVKGWMGGTYNAIGGYIKESATGKQLFELSGFWHEKMYIKDLATGKKELFFDASTAKPSLPKSRPINEQGPRESQRLWQPTVQAIKKADQRTATDEKSRVEDEQRREAAERGEEAWKPKLFKEVPAGDEEKLDWIIDAEVDHTRPVEEQVKQILSIASILPGQQWGEMAEDVQLPSQQGKPLPPKSPEQGQAQQAGGGDLIDFGQNDQSAQQGTQGGAGTKDLESSMGGMSLGRGNPVRRQDSMGQEDTFIDAES
ncbi:hypothetical protein KC335_g14956, partial [Hortaea werneckii]